MKFSQAKALHYILHPRFISGTSKAKHYSQEQQENSTSTCSVSLWQPLQQMGDPGYKWHSICWRENQTPSLEHICQPLCSLVATLRFSIFKRYNPLNSHLHSDVLKHWPALHLSRVISPLITLTNACSLPKGSHGKHTSSQFCINSESQEYLYDSG